MASPAAVSSFKRLKDNPYLGDSEYVVDNALPGMKMKPLAVAQSSIAAGTWTAEVESTVRRHGRGQRGQPEGARQDGGQPRGMSR